MNTVRTSPLSTTGYGSPVGTGGQQHRDPRRQAQGHPRPIQRTSRLAACLSTPLQLLNPPTTIADIAVAGARSGGDGSAQLRRAGARARFRRGRPGRVGSPARQARPRRDRAPARRRAGVRGEAAARHRRPTDAGLGRPARHRALVGAAERQQPLRRPLPLPAARRLASRAAVSAADRARLRSQPVHAGPGAAPDAARRAWRDESRGGTIGAREQSHLRRARARRGRRDRDGLSRQ